MLFGLSLISITTIAKKLTYEEVVEKINKDSTKNIWNIQDLSDEDYYFVGKYFAEKDTEKDIRIIQTYGNPDWMNPCKVCSYENQHIYFNYHFDIIFENITKFIEGYNDVSKTYIKKKIGDSLFTHLDDEPNSYFNPRDVLMNIYSIKGINNNFTINVINDSILNVKIKADSMFKDYPKYATKIIFHLKDLFNKEKSAEIFDYQQATEKGINLKKMKNGKFVLEIGFDFKKIAQYEEFCSCALIKETYKYLLPISVKE